jgi:hypothetical protein
MENLLDADDGRGRRILPWILEQANANDDMAAFRATSMSTLHAQLWEAVSDPKRLAMLMASEAIRCGLKMSNQHEQEYWDQTTIDACCTLPGYAADSTYVEIRLEGEDEWNAYELKGARRILAVMVQIPDGAREQAKHVLRGAP